MATEDVQRSDPDSPEIRLMQFLFVGKEYPDYQPGDWFVHKYYLAANVPSVEELAKNPDKQLLPIELIKKAYDSQLVPNPETLVFVLAVCAKQRVSEQLKKAAYKAVQDICTSPKDFLLFVKFCHQLSIFKQLNVTGAPSHGWGNGMRKAMNNWYLSKDPMELTKFVTRYRSRYGWKHKDVLKLSHLQPSSQENEVVFKYIMHGFKDAQKMYPNNPKVQDIIAYIQQVEDFKHCEDEVQSARLLEKYNLALEHVPGHMLKSTEVWMSLIPSMDTITLLNNLQRIHNLDILKPNSLAVEKILDQLRDQSKVAEDKPHPALVLITIKNYENSGKPLTYEKRKVKEQAKKALPPPPKPNSKLIDALYKTLNYSFDHLKPTGLRYMVTINMNKVMLETRAWHCGNLSGAEVGCIIALSLLRCEKNVIIATFKNVGIHSINLDKKSSFGQTMRRLQQMPVGIVNLGKPMAWANYQNNKVDVFINITDQISEKLDTSYESFEAYRTKMKLPQTKLINCAVCSSSVYRKKDQDKNILTIAGFDASVPTVIEAFAKSLF